MTVSRRLVYVVTCDRCGILAPTHGLYPEDALLLVRTRHRWTTNTDTGEAVCVPCSRDEPTTRRAGVMASARTGASSSGRGRPGGRLAFCSRIPPRENLIPYRS